MKKQIDWKVFQQFFLEGTRQIFIKKPLKINEMIENYHDHYYDQLCALRTKGKEHFLLKLIRKSYLFSSAHEYGFYIFLEGKNQRSIFLTIKHRKIESFYIPPFSFFEDLSKYYSIPIQGLYLSGELWNQWVSARYPWRSLLFATYSRKCRWMPFRFVLWIELMKNVLIESVIESVKKSC